MSLVTLKGGMLLRVFFRIFWIDITLCCDIHGSIYMCIKFCTKTSIAKNPLEYMMMNSLQTLFYWIVFVWLIKSFCSYNLNLSSKSVTHWKCMIFHKPSSIGLFSFGFSNRLFILSSTSNSLKNRANGIKIALIYIMW